MIWQLFMDIFLALVDGLIGVFFALIPPPPAWVAQGFDHAATLWDFIHDFEAWIPVDLALTIAGAVIGVWLVSMVIGLMRVVASYLTLGGGAT